MVGILMVGGMGGSFGSGGSGILMVGRLGKSTAIIGMGGSLGGIGGSLGSGGNGIRSVGRLGRSTAIIGILMVGGIGGSLGNGNGGIGTFSDSLHNPPIVMLVIREHQWRSVLELPRWLTTRQLALPPSTSRPAAAVHQLSPLHAAKCRSDRH
jgi:hypothetical protein